MQGARIIVAVLFGAWDWSIAASPCNAAATLRQTPITVWVSQFDDYGFTPGLILLSTAVILFFLPKKREGT
jgi:hypothetical protein